jgi:hypothetical protein
VDVFGTSLDGGLIGRATMLHELEAACADGLSDGAREEVRTGGMVFEVLSRG